MKTKQQKQTEAKTRKLAHEARTPRQQLNRLRANGHGECAEAIKLQQQIEVS